MKDSNRILNVALTYNLKKNELSNNYDDEAEFDDIETVIGIKNSLEKYGCNVILLEATGEIIKKIQDEKIDIVFNFAEGLKGRGREAQIPALFNMLGIPFTGSDETTLGVGLDKALSKRVVSSVGVKTPKFQLFFNGKEKLKKTLDFPLIVKPNAQGSSKGIIDKSVAKSEEELFELVNRIIDNYKEPVLVEEYIEGREFTVGLLGNEDEVEVLPIMEISFDKSNDTGFYSYNVKKDSETKTNFTCPANLTKKEEKTIRNFALKIYKVLECKDVARIDLRVSNKDNHPYFIEINPLPGLIDGFSDLTLIWKSMGNNYADLIKRILNEALKRNNMDTI